MCLMVASVEEVAVKHNLILFNIVFKSLCMHGDIIKKKNPENLEEMKDQRKTRNLSIKRLILMCIVRYVQGHGQVKQKWRF